MYINYTLSSQCPFKLCPFNPFLSRVPTAIIALSIIVHQFATIYKNFFSNWYIQKIVEEIQKAKVLKVTNHYDVQIDSFKVLQLI
jgi:hypothetical protein